MFCACEFAGGMQTVTPETRHKDCDSGDKAQGISQFFVDVCNQTITLHCTLNGYDWNFTYHTNMQ
jgi:hypothetical protein